MMRLSAYDVRLALRTLGLSILATSVVYLIAFVTDERGVATPGTGGRSIGVLPLVPVAAAIAVAITLAPARTAGELRALSALGVSPLRARLSPIAAAAFLSLAAGIGLFSQRIDVGPLFPPPAVASDVRVVRASSGAVAFVSDRDGIIVGDDDVLGTLAISPSTPGPMGLPERARAAAALTVALAGLAMALWIASPLRRRPMRTLLTGAIYGGAQIAAFQSAGAHAVPAPATALPAFVLLVVALLEHRTVRSLAREEAWM